MGVKRDMRPRVNRGIGKSYRSCFHLRDGGSKRLRCSLGQTRIDRNRDRHTGLVRPRERWMNWRKEVGDCAARQETPGKDEGHSEVTGGEELDKRVADNLPLL